MILPTKRLSADRALLTVGAEVLAAIAFDAQTVSQIWGELHRRRQESPSLAPITFDWFVLALDLLFALDAIDWDDGKLTRRTVT